MTTTAAIVIFASATCLAACPIERSTMTTTENQKLLDVFNRHHTYMVEIIDSATKVIERGWTSGGGITARDAEGRDVSPTCTNAAASWSLYGALQLAAANVCAVHLRGMSFGESDIERPVISSAFDAVISALAVVSGGKGGPCWWRLSKWNDSPERTKNDVLALLGAAKDSLTNRSPV